jgi:pimeloyl-ACP methyl ester carboxylesterase
VLRTLLRVSVIGALAGELLLGAGTGGATTTGRVRVWTLRYRAHTGEERSAYVLLPSWYGPGRNPRIPLVISPHGRGVGGSANARLWGELPAIGRFAVVNPDGAGDRLALYSWGAPGQVADLARMPSIVQRALPWLRINRRRVYAFGGSMGGQEALLLLARHPHLLAGVAAFDAVADLATQYRTFPLLRCDRACRRMWEHPIGAGLQHLARIEVGGPPSEVPAEYAKRSPISFAAAIASSCVPLQLWWSTADEVVMHWWNQSGRLLREVRRRNPAAPVEAYAGSWIHTAEFRAGSLLPFALARFRLLPPRYGRRPVSARRIPAPRQRCTPHSR